MMTRPGKVLVLAKTLNLGGAERLLVDALPYLNRQQFEYHFAYLLSGSNHLTPQFEAQGFPVHCLGMASNYRFPLMLPRLNGLQRRHHFDLIHAHLPLPGILARLAGRWSGIPVVYTEHNLPERQHPLTQAISRLSYGWNQQVFAVSQGVTDSLIRLGWAEKTQVTTMLNGIPVEQVRAEAGNLDELRQEFNIPAGHLIVGSVAVFSPQKCLGDWLHVARQVANQRDDVTFVLTGYGPDEAIIKAKVQALGLVDRVRLPGFRRDARRLMGLMDVYLMSSEFEGLPVALLEAMALARPVVATAVGGIPEVVTHGREGFLVPFGAVEQLTGFTLQLLNDPKLRHELGQKGARRIEAGFHMKERVKLTENMYLRLLQSANNTTPVLA